ncbi:hypothetical protein [Methanocalculus sp.]|uniref:hypothetical protein n=1 Tax=Methanocalculus sp. TaxID=2004547 RepID=UPI002607A2CC|nr:hypothetical protein [Methanocalculus sp.]MDG6249534.1 hypothetical protein [Methanocalculus sp.]
MQQSGGSVFVNQGDVCPTIDKDILIKLSKLTKGKILDRRRDIRKNIILTTLGQFKINDTFKFQDLTEKIYYLIRCKFEKELVLPILATFEEEGLIEHIGELTYRIIDNIEIPDISESISPVWNEFLQEYIINKKIQYDRYIHKNAQKAFNEIILKIISQFTLSEPFESQVESIPIDNIQLLVSSIVDNVCFPDQKFNEKLKNSIIDYLTSEASNNQNLLTLISSCYDAIININLLKREQGFKSLDINFSDSVSLLLLDTNFIITLLTKTDPKHSLSVALVKQCEKSKIPLRYSSLCKNELNNLIKSVMTEMSNIGVTSRRAPSDNQLILDYFKDKEEQETTWSEYSTYLSNWEIFIQRYNIYPLEHKITTNCDDTIFDLVKIALKTYDEVSNNGRIGYNSENHKKFKSEESYDHDALSVAYIYKIKTDNEKKSANKQYGPWFLSYDNRLSAVNQANLMKHNEFGFVIQPRILLNYIHVFSNISIDENEEEEFALALLRYTARIAHPKLTLGEYSQLVAIKTGIGEENAKILYEIFLQSPLKDDLQKALYDKNSELADQKAVEILNLTNLQVLMEKYSLTQQQIENYEAERERYKFALKKQREENQLKDQEIKTLRSVSTKTYYYNNSNTVIINGDTVNIQIDAELDPKIMKKLFGILDILESENAFESGLIDPPPKEINESTLKRYLSQLQTNITKSSVAQGVKDLLPIIASTLSILNNL